jgi:hypothetical protein
MPTATRKLAADLGTRYGSAVTKTALLMIALLAASAHAEELQMNDPNYEVLIEVRKSIDGSWYREDNKGPWLVSDDAGDMSGARCTAALAAAAKAGVPSTRKIPLQNDNPELMKGEHALADLKPVCANIERLAKIRVWEKWAIGAARGTAGGSNDARQFARCKETYDELLKAGVAKTAKVQEREILADDQTTKIKWSGTVGDLQAKHCDNPSKKNLAATADREAPYRKVLKADKLSMALTTGQFYVLGGALVSDPGKLAAAKVWFSDTQSANSDRKTCNGGQEIHTLVRYQFDAGHKLVKTTDSLHCGKVPAKAFK